IITLSEKASAFSPQWKNPLRPDSSLGDKNILRKLCSLPYYLFCNENAYALRNLQFRRSLKNIITSERIFHCLDI
ncbi:MAG: hypothetical protein RR313_11990, partial [Anaerovoracaceae bacterium]